VFSPVVEEFPDPEIGGETDPDGVVAAASPLIPMPRLAAVWLNCDKADVDEEEDDGTVRPEDVEVGHAPKVPAGPKLCVSWLKPEGREEEHRERCLTRILRQTQKEEAEREERKAKDLPPLVER